MTLSTRARSPRRAKELRYTKTEATRHGLRFYFQMDEYEHSCFTTVPAHFWTLPAQQQRLLATQVGISYLLDMAIICFPHRISVEVASLPDAALRFWMDAYRELTMDRIFGEQLDVTLRDGEWTSSGEPLGEPLPAAAPGKKKRKTLLAMSGGKESLSALNLFRDLPDLTLFYLHYPLAAWYRQSIVYEKLRDRFPTLKLRTDVTSTQRLQDHFGCKDYCTSVIEQLIFHALLLGDEIGWLIIGNEYSARFGNFVYQGATVNHQCDKTLEFAERANAYVAQYVHRDFLYFSPLFGLYEYKIAELLLSDSTFLDLLTSCNQSNRSVNFCGRCPKCAFAYAILRAHGGKAIVDRYFGRDLMEDLALFRPLMDFDAVKPLECVGEKKEVWLALHKIDQRQLPTDEKPAVLRHFLSTIHPKIKEQLPAIEDELNREQTGFALLPKELRNTVASRIPNLRS